ncbi:hypothetical protein P0D71_00435 [Paraburkholderia sp. RL17-383-BIF-A]|uniref:hypothetical protein n=1 Tax=Paraburkholderia sp. RL17-383-BIF-A TaxID=3031631 RepID=UPI0038B955E2
MTDDAALQMGRKAIEDARKRVGDDREAVLKELLKRAQADPELAKAFEVSGMAIVIALKESAASTKH